MANLTKKYFDDYKMLTSYIRSLERREKYYREHPMLATHGVVSGSMENFPYAKCHFIVGGAAINLKSSEQRKQNVNQLLIDIAGNKQLLEDMRIEIEQFIEKSDMPVEDRLLLRMRFIEGRKLESIADEMGYTLSSISKKIDAILSGIDKKIAHGERV